MNLTRTQALDLLKQYNKDPFHIRHALTVEAVMGWFARELGYGDEADFWSAAGLLHDLDFEMWPDPRHRQSRLGAGLRCQAGARDGEGPFCL